MNVLGVIFDSKLNWNAHIANAIRKSRKALFGLSTIKKFFNQIEMRMLLDSNFFSVLYYNAVIWLTPSIMAPMKQSLLSASACALRSCLNCEPEISFESLHLKCNKSTPKQIMLYQAALQLHKTLNSCHNVITTETIRVLEQIVCTRRQLTFEIHRANNTKIGMNTQANKFYHITKMVSLDRLNLNYAHFKKIMKLQFLKYGKT